MEGDRERRERLTGDTVNEKSLSSSCIDTPDSCSNSGILYSISGICPELTSVPLFDLREPLNLKTTLLRTKRVIITMSTRGDSCHICRR